MIRFFPKFNWPWNNTKESVYTSTPIWVGFGKVRDFNKIYTTKQDNNLLIQYFNEVAEFAAPILKYVDGAKNIKIKSSDPDVEKLLLKPNYYQTGMEHFASFVLYYMVFGESVINAVVSRTALNGTKPTSLFNMTPQYMGIKTEQDKYASEYRDFRTDKIVKYLFNQDRQGVSTLKSDPEYILHLKETHPNFEETQYLFGESRAASCYMAIESIREGYGAKTNLYSDGPRLIITGKTQGEFAAQNESEDIEVIQERMKKYNWKRGGFKNLVTDKALDVFNASLNVAQLQIKENNASDFDTICNAFGMDSKIFSYFQGSTFANKEAALKDFYNNSFKSVIEIAIDAYESFLKRWWPNLQLEPDFSKIQEIVDAELESHKKIFEDVKMGLMTRNDYLERIGRDKINLPEFNQYYVFDGKNWQSLERNEQETITEDQREEVETITEPGQN